MKNVKNASPALVEPSFYAQGLICRKASAYWERMAKFFSAIMLAVFPFLLGFSGYGDITESKFVIFEILTGLLIFCTLLICVGYLLEKKEWKTRKNEGFRRLTLAQILVIGFCVWGIICAVVSPYGELWQGQSRYEGVLSMLLYAIVFILVSMWAEYSDYYVPAMAVCATVQALICILQIFNINLIYPEGYTYYNSNFLGTLGNIDIVGGFTAVVVPVLACGYILLETRWRYAMLSGAALVMSVQFVSDVDSSKMGLLAAAVLTLPFLLTTREHIVRTLRLGGVFSAMYAVHRLLSISSDGTLQGHIHLHADKLFAASLILCLVLGAAAWLLHRSEKPLSWSEKKIRLVIAGVEILVAIVALIYLYGYTGSNTLLGDIRDFLHGELSDYAGSARGFVWKACLKLMAAAPIFGCGPGAFEEAFSPYNREELGVIFDFAHNDFLQVGVCMGYVGLAIYVAFVVVLAVHAIKYGSRNPLVVIFASGVAGYLAHSFFSFSIAIITPMFWVLAGVMERLVYQLPDGPFRGLVVPGEKKKKAKAK